MVLFFLFFIFSEGRGGRLRACSGGACCAGAFCTTGSSVKRLVLERYLPCIYEGAAAAATGYSSIKTCFIITGLFSLRRSANLKVLIECSEDEEPGETQAIIITSVLR